MINMLFQAGRLVWNREGSEQWQRPDLSEKLQLVEVVRGIGKGKNCQVCDSAVIFFSLLGNILGIHLTVLSCYLCGSMLRGPSWRCSYGAGNPTGWLLGRQASESVQWLMALKVFLSFTSSLLTLIKNKSLNDSLSIFWEVFNRVCF